MALPVARRVGAAAAAELLHELNEHLGLLRGRGIVSIRGRSQRSFLETPLKEKGRHTKSGKVGVARCWRSVDETLMPLLRVRGSGQGAVRWPLAPGGVGRADLASGRSARQDCSSFLASAQSPEMYLRQKRCTRRSVRSLLQPSGFLNKTGREFDAGA